MRLFKDKQVRLIINIILAVFALGGLAFALSSCNPVKKVLKDTAKMGKVFDEGVKLGWCVNDTITISQSDTLITFDTLFAIDYNTDTLTVDREVVQTRYVTKTVKIRDTVTKVITDNSRINLLQKQLIKKDGELLEKFEQLKKSQGETKQARQARNKCRLCFFILLAAITAFILRKPILKLIKPI